MRRHIIDGCQATNLPPSYKYERLQLLMKQMIKQVQASVDLAKADALKQQLTDSEIQHVDTCIQIIDESVEELSAEVELITAMSD